MTITFRTRLLVVLTGAVALAVTGIAVAVTSASRRAFERFEQQRIQALEAQFQREYVRRGRDVAAAVGRVAGSESIERIQIAASLPEVDYSQWVDEAQALSSAYGLDFLELVGPDGAIISSAQWPARFGYKEEWVLAQDSKAFLKSEPLPEETALGLFAVRPIRAGEQTLYLAGGQRIDRDFLASLGLGGDMRAMLYAYPDAAVNSQSVVDSNGPVAGAERLAPLINRVRRERVESSLLVRWSTDAASEETVRAFPLMGVDRHLLGVLLIGSSRRRLVSVEQSILSAAIGLGALGILLGVILSWWATARITRPVERLVEGAERVSLGDWSARVDVRTKDEMGQLATAFNTMTGHLASQRERLVQAERVAAWRELARRLAHELKNPLFPLQITVENMKRAREQYPQEFDEVFQEGTDTLLAELAKLRGIIGRFSDFARMPAPQLEPVDLNALVRESVQLFEPQFQAPDRPPTTTRMELDPAVGTIPVDADQIA
ncbi:MAG: HAMP domain-containing protein, partial [Acidobacteria bacterium]|nr:HAMP domain-containing protein [Acidobacteriota bacterium]